MCDGDAEVLGAGGVDSDGIEGTEVVEEVVAVLVCSVLDAEVVYDEGEHDGSGGVAEETGGGAGESVAGGSEVFDEAVLGQLAGVRQTVDAFADFGDD